MNTEDTDSPIDKKAVEFFIRVPLPMETKVVADHLKQLQYRIDNETYGDISKMIFAVKPSGFEVRWSKVVENWGVDSEGNTLVPLYCTSKGTDKIIQTNFELRKQLEYIRSELKKLV